MSDPIGGWAAATTEVFKALRDLGQTVAEPVRELVGMAADHAKVVRWERQLALVDRVKATMKRRGLDRLDRKLPLTTLLPLLEHATLEEDDDLQDVWAEMLVNAGDAGSPIEMRRAYVSMLADMTAFDVRVLAAVHDATPQADQSVWTEELPERAVPYQDDGPRGSQPREDVRVSLGNVARLGCVSFGITFGAGPDYTLVTLTELGRAFVRACTQERSSP